MRRPRGKAKRAAAPAPLPSVEELRRFLSAAPGRVARRDIARHFNLSREQRPALRQLLRALRAEGHLEPAGRRGVALPLQHRANLPEMAVVEIIAVTEDGEILARPVTWQGPERPPSIVMRPEPPGRPALAPGERVLARLRHLGRDRYEGRSYKRLGRQEVAPIIGVVRHGRVLPTDRRQKGEWQILAGEAEEGDIVLAAPVAQLGRPLGPRPLRVLERLGRIGEARAISLIAIAAHGIPDRFPPEAEAQAKRARAISPTGREDLRGLPLVTIDGEDARDFDDAVYAEAEGEGWRVVVAIADVAHYVRPGTALDREARRRGNSVYFPDRVVPMLPEALSNGWCSLRPGEDRGCLFVEMRFDAAGNKLSHRFGRGIMRSAARLTYEEVQGAAESGRDLPGLPAGHLGELYGAFRALAAARQRRGSLELDLPERRVVLGPDGRVVSVTPRPRLDSHRLIEEFMVAANVCAAEELERLSQPCMYRVHDSPSEEKLAGLRQFLARYGIRLPSGRGIRPGQLAQALRRLDGHPEQRLIHETLLRAQAQAAYSPDNMGHFGLALPRYAHFTSPIRRYADLLVHRALIRGLRLGRDGLTEAEAAEFPAIAEHITMTERRAVQAERDALDRYLAAFMAERVGEVFAARISGVTRFGLFATLEETGASGLLSFSGLPDDRWEVEESPPRLRGRRTGLVFALGDELEVVLQRADPLTGSLQFALAGGVGRMPGRGRRAGVRRGT
ncbi:MAG: ribonuclease R [Rhodovarius sp.]|nr:ribonuclease R [Rhodovarius sp.]